MKNTEKKPVYLRAKKWDAYVVTDEGVIMECSTSSREKKLYFIVGFPFPDTVKFSFRKTKEADAKREELRAQMLSYHAHKSVGFACKECSDRLVLDTGRVRVELVKEPFQLIAKDAEGREFFSQMVEDTSICGIPESLPMGFIKSEEAYGGFAALDSIRVQPDEAFYGFGEIFSPVDKRGSMIDSWTCDAHGVIYNRAYKNIPFFMSTRGYGLFIYSTARIHYDLAAHSQVACTVKVDEDEYSSYLFYGPEFKQILKRYSELTGFAPIPPKYSFGLWMSRFGYKSRKELEGICEKLRERSIPCDVVHLDPYWMGDFSEWCHLEWDEVNFPEPEDMIAELGEKGFKVCLWENSYVPVNTEMFEEGREKGYLVKGENGDVYLSEHWSNFGKESGMKQAYVDFTNPEAIQWYKNKHRDLISATGPAVFKTDFGESAPADGKYFSAIDGHLVHNIYPLLYNCTVYEAMKDAFGDEALVWARSAYAGSQRYPVHWGGDSKADFANMASQLRGLLSLGMSGIPFSSHDIGGFMGQKDKGKLYVRWAQFGLFSSHARCHGKFPKEPWEYGEEVENCFREAVELRYRLLPYIYSEACTSAQTGLPVVRPMILEFQEDKRMRNVDLQYMFGKSILAAPIFNEEGTVTVLFPQCGWFDYWTLDKIEGFKCVEKVYPLNRMPLFIQEGSIIPMLRDKVQYIGNRSWDKLDLHIYGGDKGSYILYDKVNGSNIKTPVCFERGEKGIRIRIENNISDIAVFYHDAVSCNTVIVNGMRAEYVDSVESLYNSDTLCWNAAENTAGVYAGRHKDIQIVIEG